MKFFIVSSRVCFALHCDGTAVSNTPTNDQHLQTSMLSSKKNGCEEGRKEGWTEWQKKESEITGVSSCMDPQSSSLY